MKKSIISAAFASIIALTGCTTVESTQKFNAVQLGTQDEKHICQSYVQIPGYFFLGLPIIVGSAKGDGQTTMFRYNLTTENVMYLLTKEDARKTDFVAEADAAFRSVWAEKAKHKRLLDRRYHS